MDEHDPLGLDARAMENPDLADAQASVLRRVELARQTMAAPRYVKFFGDGYTCSVERKKLIEDNLTWAAEHARRHGQEADAPDEDGITHEYDIETAKFKIAWAEEEIRCVTERVDDWASDPL